MRVVEELYARGHPNVTAKHPTTFEITKDPELTRRGDCVVAVQATKAPVELSSEFKRLCRNDEAKVVVELQAIGVTESIEGRGCSRLRLSHSRDIVGRKSTHASERTIMILADKAAADINRDLIDALRFPRTKLQVRIIAEL